MSHDRRRDAGERAESRVLLRPLASGLPLGFFAFAVGTVLLSALELQWAPLTQDSALMTLVLAFVVPLEALSGLFAFLAGDSGSASGLITLSAAWLAMSVTVLQGRPGALSLPLGIFLFSLTTVMLIMSVAAFAGKPLFGLLMLLGACRFALTGVYQAAGTAAAEHAAGWLGIPLALFALYGGLAALLTNSYRRPVPPFGPRGSGRTSLAGGYARRRTHGK